jgi:ABC-2 type transport system ATP-binding protein
MTSSGTLAVETHKITKRYGQLTAVDGVSLSVAGGAIYALLGPNGAGKTTLVGMLTTLVQPTAGTARVAGADIIRDPHRVRHSVGVVLQESALDRYLPLEENLYFLARVYHIPAHQRRRRIDEVLDFLNLERSRKTPVGQLSGGTIRRAEIAAGILHEPDVLLLDEPTVGLDIEARQNIWRHVRDVSSRGTAVILTTHYLEEADRLADAVGILSHGRLVAEGTPAELKTSLTRRRITLYPEQVDNPAVERAIAHWRTLGTVAIDTDPSPVIQIEVADEETERTLLHDVAGRSEIPLQRLEVGPGSLDNVFLAAVRHGSGQEETDHVSR